jgi:hypothetical protein
MPRLITQKRAYAIASSWGSYLSNSDPGACFYGFRADDGRPVSEAHRVQCLTYGRRLLNLERLGAKDRRELHQLVRFHANCEV